MKCLANSEFSASKATANSVLFFSNAGVEGFEEPCMYACMCMYVCMYVRIDSKILKMSHITKI